MLNKTGREVLLWSFGINKKYQGFHYIIYGIELCVQDENCLNYITKDLYQDIAIKYHTSWECVERDIRTVVDIIWNYGNRELIFEINGSRFTDKPVNAKFFKILTKYVMRLSDETDRSKEE